MSERKKLWLIICILTLIGGHGAAAADTAMPTGNESVSAEDYFSGRDLKGDWEEKNAVYIRWENGAADCGSEAVEISGGHVIIREAGVYVLTGETSDGSVTVDADKNDKVQLVLSGVRITARATAAILVENADKVFITLAAGKENTLISAAFDKNSDVDAAVFSRDDVTLNGAGRLTITSARHGIVCNDDLRITGGAYHITAEDRGIDANDSVRIYDGEIAVVSGRDAVRAKHDEENKGWVLMLGGVLDLNVGGGAENGETHAEDWGFRSRGGRNGRMEALDSGESRKGVKASGNLVILGGTVTIDAADDALHTDSDLAVRGGDLTLLSGDDAMHADRALTVSGGRVRILKSYEGLEAQNITVSGGDIALKASDDGLNAAGGKDESGFGWQDMFASDGVSSICITGGNLYIDAAGDGIDSNGDLLVSGGVTVVSGPTDSANGALDYNGSGVITGGTVIAAGAVGMAETFGASSTQPSVLVRLSGQAGSEITVKDENGNTILAGAVDKQFSSVVISCPDLQVGKTYTVSSGKSSVQITVTDVTNRNGTDGNPFGPSGGGPGGRW